MTRAACLAGIALLAPPDQQRIDRGPVALHYWPEQARLGERVADRLQDQRALPALPPDVFRGQTVHVFLAPDPARWDSLTGGAVPEWGAGVADPVRGIIVLPTYDWGRRPPDALYRVLRHELAHVGLQQFLGDVRVPRWFSEGYAQWAAGQWDWDSAWRLRLALLSGRAPPLDSLTLDWPRDEADARTAYLLSASALGYLVDRSGERGLRIFMERWRETRDFDLAFRTTYGRTLGQFEEDWRRHVRRIYAWPLFLGHSLFFWLIAAIALLVLFAIRRKRDRERMEVLRTTEPPDVPAYWDPDREPEPDDPWTGGGPGGSGPAGS